MENRNNENILISIIMPVYNSARFLNGAIESVLKQTYYNFELLLINDGSTDDSGKICEEYSLKDNRVIVKHQNNGGVCSARNLGIVIAKGQYIAFIDNDDIYRVNYLEVLVEMVINTNADVLKCGRVNIKITSKLKILKETSCGIGDNLVMTWQEFIQNYYLIKKSGILSSVWNGLYKRDFIINYDITFREDVRHGNEDLLFNYSVFLNAPTIAISNQSLYVHYYRIRHSTSTQFFEDQIESRIEAIKLERRYCSHVSKRTDKLLLEFEGIRECFRILAQSHSHKIQRDYVGLLKSKLDFSIFDEMKYFWQFLDRKQKIDCVLFKNKLFNLYFLYKRVQTIFKQ